MDLTLELKFFYTTLLKPFFEKYNIENKTNFLIENIINVDFKRGYLIIRFKEVA